MNVNSSDNLNPKKHPIRFGLTCDGPILFEYQARCLEYLLSLDSVSLALLIIIGPAGPILTSEKTRKVDDHKALSPFYMRFLSKTNALSPRDLSDDFATVPRMCCEFISKEGGQGGFSEATVQTIRSYELDFILHFSSSQPPGETLNLACYGVWSFRQGNYERYRGGPPCFWEIYYNDPVTDAALQMLTGSHGQERVLKKGFLKTIHDSYTRNVDAIFFESARWPAQVCIDIRNGNIDYLSSTPEQTRVRALDFPSNFESLVLVFKILRNKLSKQYDHFFRHAQWNIGLVNAPIHRFLDANSKPAIRYLPLRKRGSFIADPFGIRTADQVILVCEEYDNHQGKGSISTRELGDERSSFRRVVGMDLPFHMSYPYLLEYGGEIYCIPDTRGPREIRLYKAQPFPHRWAHVSTLVSNIDAIDATIFEHQGMWWLTYVAAQEVASNANLCVWYAPKLVGPWKEHATNPVKTDVRSARPAGTPFHYQGELYRPAQDCSRSYGARVVLNRVMRLTPTEFQEEPAAFVEPDRNSFFPDGLHTLSAVGDITLVDGKRIVFSPSAFRHAASLISRSVANKLLPFKENRAPRFKANNGAWSK